MSAPTPARRRVRRVAPVSRAVRTSRGGGPPTPGARAGRRRTGALRHLIGDDAAMSTVEYAIGCVAAAAFAAALYAVVSGESIVTALTQIVQRALTAGF